MGIISLQHDGASKFSEESNNHVCQAFDKSSRHLTPDQSGPTLKTGGGKRRQPKQAVFPAASLYFPLAVENFRSRKLSSDKVTSRLVWGGD